jgi:hypothetical protein
VDRKLETILVFIDQAFDLEKIVLLEGVEDLFHVVPHLGFEMAAAVAEGKCEVWLTALLRFDLLGNYDEAGGNDLVFVLDALTDVEIFHENRNDLVRMLWTQARRRAGCSF